MERSMTYVEANTEEVKDFSGQGVARIGESADLSLILGYGWWQWLLRLATDELAKVESSGC